MAKHRLLSILITVSLFTNLFWMKNIPPTVAQADSSNSHSASATQIPPLLGVFGWNSTNIQSALNPDNRRGLNPAYETIGVSRSALGGRGLEDNGGAGSSNYQLDVPLLHLPGRGINLNLNLHYNSLLWHKADTMVFDIDEDWPAPGWSLSFGKLIMIPGPTLGDPPTYIFVEPNGTRHLFERYDVSVDYATDLSERYDARYTADGSLIDLVHVYTHIWTDTHPPRLKDIFLSAVYIKYPHGKTISFPVNRFASACSNCTKYFYANRIIDANGNYISIFYRNGIGPEINRIDDTRGREVIFNYNESDKLISISAPGISSPRTVVRLFYSKKHVTSGFQKSLITEEWQMKNIPVVGEVPVYVGPDAYDKDYDMLTAIYFPGSNTGYWFSDFSSYGMMTRISRRRAMQVSSSPLTVTQGVMTYEVSYNYSLNPDPTLQEAPGYTIKTEIWEGMTTPPAVTKYKVFECPPTGSTCRDPRRIEVTYPDGTQSLQLSYNNPGKFNDGLVYDAALVDAEGRGTKEDIMTWEEGERGSPRLKHLETSDELGQSLITEYSYGPKHNQITEIRSFDYDGVTLLQRVQIEYVTNENYEKKHSFNLPSVIQVFGGSSTIPESYIEYAYDTEPLSATPGVTHLTTWSDPVNQTYRGNVTSIIRYADAANRTGVVTERRIYDTTGNLIQISGSCCVQKTLSYSLATQYSFPDEITLGSKDASFIETKIEYDYYTGVPIIITDSNGNKTYFSYLPGPSEPLRLEKVTKPSGAQTVYSYDDTTLTVTETTFDNEEAVARQIERRNGLGLVHRFESWIGDSNWSVVEWQYDVMGRVWKQSQPFFQATDPNDEQKYWNVFGYDGRGRPISFETPDGSISYQYYNEYQRPEVASQKPGQTVRIGDAWGRERWMRTNALGQLEEVVMPDPIGDGSVLGSGGVATHYAYNTLGLLTQVIQGPDAQARRFKYDSLGRLTHQYLPERSSSLNDVGEYPLGSSGKWSDVFAYDERGNLISRSDARGVKTIYEYGGDPLDRLQSITYDMSGVGYTSNLIVPAGDVHFDYMSTGDIRRAWRVRTDGLSAEEYFYDTLGRPSAKRLTLASHPDFPLETGYYFDGLDRLTSILYPAGSTSKWIQYAYQKSGFVSDIIVDDETYADIQYNPAGQITQIYVGPIGPSQHLELNQYDPITLSLRQQQVLGRLGTSSLFGLKLLDLSYEYIIPTDMGPAASKSGQTGQLTRVTDNLNLMEGTYSYDAWERLSQTLMKSTKIITTYEKSWLQKYSYDPYGNRTDVKAVDPKTSFDCNLPFLCTPQVELPSTWQDGLGELTYDTKTNHITTPGFEYDAAGNQISTLLSNGNIQYYQYDAAGRLVNVLDKNRKLVESYGYYDATNRRLSMQSGTIFGPSKYYIWHRNAVIAEYQETPEPGNLLKRGLNWAASYVYLGNRLLVTFSGDSDGDTVHYSHPDRISTRLITDVTNSTNSLQATFPFGLEIPGSQSGNSGNVFSTYQRSQLTELDYAVNRYYDPQQGRFSQIDPFGIAAINLENPSSINMFAYVRNDPVNHIDPTGLTDEAPCDPCVPLEEWELAKKLPVGGETIVKDKRLPSADWKYYIQLDWRYALARYGMDCETPFADGCGNTEAGLFSIFRNKDAIKGIMDLIKSLKGAPIQKPPPPPVPRIIRPLPTNPSGPGGVAPEDPIFEVPKARQPPFIFLINPCISYPPLCDPYHGTGYSPDA